MAVEIKNSLGLEQGYEADSAQAEEQIKHNFAHCLNCEAQVILLARTIQTFCYHCGEAVTVPDEADMYYEIRTNRA